ncbi:MAG: SRPBCC domain-containing protein [Deltaproteobacteria bacterium]|nr:SRPBCC domain-containing protein [Deltaproteobacteria bacterium]
MTIRKSIRVERSPEISFRVFCEGIGEWWPKGTSFNGKLLKNTIIEERIGGRFFELYADGTEYEIGRITAFEPPALVGFTWRAPSWDHTTQVQVRFTAEGAGTRVELEHSGWDQSDNLRETSKNYDRGWEFVLGHFVTHIAAAA